MNKTLSKTMLLIAAMVATFTALAHSSCLFLGAECYEYQMAPEAIVISAQNGTWLAPLGTLAVSGVFIIWAGYALSGANIIRRLPFQSKVIYIVSTLCLMRGALGIQLWLRKPELVTDFANISNWVWFLTGMFLLVGFRGMRRHREAV